MAPGLSIIVRMAWEWALVVDWHAVRLSSRHQTDNAGFPYSMAVEAPLDRIGRATRRDPYKPRGYAAEPTNQASQSNARACRNHNCTTTGKVWRNRCCRLSDRCDGLRTLQPERQHNATSAQNFAPRSGKRNGDAA